jgi:hypothetical protein
MLSALLLVIGPTILASGVAFAPLIKRQAIAWLTPTLKEKVDPDWTHLTLIQEKMELEGKLWLFNEGKARFPREGAYKFYVDMEDKHVIIPGDRTIKLPPYWVKVYGSLIRREVARQNLETIVRHLYPEKAQLLLS